MGGGRGVFAQDRLATSAMALRETPKGGDRGAKKQPEQTKQSDRGVLKGPERSKGKEHNGRRDLVGGGGGTGGRGKGEGTSGLKGRGP